MKKSLFLSFTLLTSCISNQNTQAHSTGQGDTQEEAMAAFEQMDEATQNRVIKTAAFLSLAEKVRLGEIDARNLVYFALEWAKELEESDDADDQELSKRLYAIVVELTENLQALQGQEGDAQESNEASAEAK